MNCRLSSNSASVSPGKPTMTSAPTPQSGISARAFRTRSGLAGGGTLLEERALSCNQRKDRQWLSVVMDSELEAIGQQRLEHRLQGGLRSAGRGLGDDIELAGIEPGRATEDPGVIVDAVGHRNETQHGRSEE